MDRKITSKDQNTSVDYLVIGECLDKSDLDAGEIFSGRSGVEFLRMIQQAGIRRNNCYVTNVLPYYPVRGRIIDLFYNKTKAKETPHEVILGKAVHPKIAEGVRELEKLIKKLKPKVIIAFGNAGLWSVTGEWGITKWRGSSLRSREIEGLSIPVLSTFSHSSIFAVWSRRYIIVHDLRKAKQIRDTGLKVPSENYIIRPNYETVITTLKDLLFRADASKNNLLDISVDIETRFRHITCLGLAWSAAHAICIPFLEIKNEDCNYWNSVEEEVEICWLLKKLLTHPNVRVIGQNFPYDQQYIARRMAFIPNYKHPNFQDTMTAHHVMFAGLPKGLDFLSSFYGQDDHVYWKDEGKEWNPKTHDEEQHWIYNAKDACRTWIVAQEQRKIYESLNFSQTTYGSPWTIQHDSHESVLRAMLRGVKVDKKARVRIAKELGETITKLEEYINDLLGHPLNPRSPKQLSTLFYTDFRVKPVFKYDRATGTRKRTCDANALDTIGKREILLAPLCTAISDVRSLGTFRSVATQELDHDDRLRCSYSVPGTETYRYNSKEDAFGFGTNLQNVSAGNEKEEKSSHLYRPNLRKMLIPDEGYIISDHDLDQADARIVAWESDCSSLKEIFNDPTRDLHNENCEIIFGKCTGKADPNRQRAKQGVHAANYGATAPVIAIALGITIREAENFMERYFAERPEVLAWHEKIENDLQTKRYVENIFGYRRFYFDRIDNLLKEALAWIPQSTVAISVNIGIKQVERNLPWAQFLLQVHDSAVHQFPENRAPVEESFELIRQNMQVPLPYADPMTIPVSGEWSRESWGHCK